MFYNSFKLKSLCFLKAFAVEVSIGKASSFVGFLKEPISGELRNPLIEFAPAFT